MKRPECIHDCSTSALRGIRDRFKAQRLRHRTDRAGHIHARGENLLVHAADPAGELVPVMAFGLIKSAPPDSRHRPRLDARQQTNQFIDLRGREHTIRRLSCRSVNGESAADTASSDGVPPDSQVPLTARSVASAASLRCTPGPALALIAAHHRAGHRGFARS